LDWIDEAAGILPHAEGASCARIYRSGLPNGDGICVLTEAGFEEHRARRQNAKGGPEPHYQLLGAVPQGKSFRVYMNAPGKKKTALTNQIVSRNDFPRAIFEGTV
jgi:hypothetical protein